MIRWVRKEEVMRRTKREEDKSKEELEKEREEGRKEVEEVS